MGVNVKIESGGTVFEMALESQNTIVVDNGDESFTKLIEMITRITRAVHIETSNSYEVELLDLSKFDNRMGLCLRSLQKKYFGVSEEGEERFHFFRLSTKEKDKERYQRMLEGYWKAYTEERKNSDGGKIVIVAADSFIKSAEFKALYQSDKVNYYVLLMKRGLQNAGYDMDVVYEFDTAENVHTLKRK